MNGILLVDKPSGWTSHDAVAKVRSILKNATGSKIKVGHTGTLDPLATGLLVLVLGSYTKRAQEFSKLDKTYEAELTLGQVSTTGDSEGIKQAISDKKPTRAEVKTALGRFKGEISQTPPIFSAVKVDGQRAYKAARAGKTLEIKPRKVTIYDISRVEYDYPTLKFTAKVSSGTYVRSLAEDIGNQLGAGAYLSALRRTTVGQYDISEALALNEFNTETIAATLK
jgi:tRNA pseudouridine55 synthase